MTTPISPTGTSVGPVAGMSSGTSTSSAAGSTQLSSQAFLQLLVAQLQYQDPSSPVDTASFMNETATLTQVQSMQQDSQNITALLSAQKAQTATGLVGHSVSYLGTDGSTKTGVVTAATLSATDPTLKIGSDTITLDQVQQVLSTTG